MRVHAAEPDNEKVDDDRDDKREKHREHTPHERPVEVLLSQLYSLKHLSYVEPVDEEVPEEGDTEEDAHNNNEQLDDQREYFDVDLHRGGYSADLWGCGGRANTDVAKDWQSDEQEKRNEKD